MFQGKYAFDQDTQRKVLRAAPNPQWLAQVRARVPLDSKVIVMCSDGRQRSVEALEILEDEGYTNLVGMGREGRLERGSNMRQFNACKLVSGKH